ncbi:hypothetical protein O181_051786 [Austropuccinia psidii MF-1]|uniref:Uncharacterized protein n=1 Tax=Austropuccinia psidii MF-1 TaxID=1389203 RepID=A0A9Q3DX39_9BASI|nr:hypothetical protein [Austropuccinia psidii MF-1]
MASKHSSAKSHRALYSHQDYPSRMIDIKLSLRVTIILVLASLAGAAHVGISTAPLEPNSNSRATHHSNLLRNNHDFAKPAEAKKHNLQPSGIQHRKGKMQKSCDEAIESSDARAKHKNHQYQLNMPKNNSGFLYRQDENVNNTRSGTDQLLNTTVDSALKSILSHQAENNMSQTTAQGYRPQRDKNTETGLAGSTPPANPTGELPLVPSTPQNVHNIDQPIHPRQACYVVKKKGNRTNVFQSNPTQLSNATVQFSNENNASEKVNIDPTQTTTVGTSERENFTYPSQVSNPIIETSFAPSQPHQLGVHSDQQSGQVESSYPLQQGREEATSFFASNQPTWTATPLENDSSWKLNKHSSQPTASRSSENNVFTSDDLGIPEAGPSLGHSLSYPPQNHSREPTGQGQVSSSHEENNKPIAEDGSSQSSASMVESTSPNSPPYDLVKHPHQFSGQTNSKNNRESNEVECN